MSEATRGDPTALVDQDGSVAGGTTLGLHDAASPSPRIQPGARVGRYLVLEEIGAGGMGVVLRAYDPRLQREVALKHVRHRRGAEEEARLVREAHAMARLNHPNVVAVHDVETNAHGVVLVMEYVAGHTLADWLSAERREWQSIVAAFIDAGRGLLAAHEAGLLHRDFKPANVFVGDDGRVRVGDFGLARWDVESITTPALDADDELVPTNLTGTGFVIGTPRYMAPEQHRGDSLGAAADQFAFCVALREALSGQVAFDGRSVAELSAQKSKGPSPWPAGTEVPEAVALAVQRGLAADPRERWPDLRPLIAELEAARSPRHDRVRWVIGALAIGIVAAIVAFQRDTPAPCRDAGYHLDGVWPARKAELGAAFSATGLPYADAARREVERRFDAFGRAWADAYVDACEATHVRGEQSAARLDLRMDCLQTARGALVASVDVLASADAEVVERAVEVASALPSIPACEDPAPNGRDRPADGPDAEAWGQVEQALALAHAQRIAGRFESAAAAAQAACSGEVVARHPPLASECDLELGLIEMRLGRAQSAHDRLARAFEISLTTGDTQRAAMAGAYLASVIGARPGERDAARWVGRIALQLARRLGSDTREEAVVLNAMAGLLPAESGAAEAVKAHRLALAAMRAASPDDAAIPTLMSNLSSALGDLGAYDESLPLAREAIALRSAAVGEMHPSVALMHSVLGAGLFGNRDLEGAEDHMRRSLEIRRESLPKDHPSIGTALTNLAAVLHEAGRSGEAEPLLAEALTLAEHHFGPTDPQLYPTVTTLGNVRRALGRTPEAIALQHWAVALRELDYGIDDPALAAPLVNLAAVLLSVDRPAAVAVLRRASRVVSHLSTPQPVAITVHANLGILCRWVDDLECARAELGRALEDARAVYGENHPDVAKGLIDLADLERVVGDTAAATSLYEQAAVHPRLPDTTAVSRAILEAGRARLAWSDPTRRDAARIAVQNAYGALTSDGRCEDDECRELAEWMREVGIDPP